MDLKKTPTAYVRISRSVVVVLNLFSATPPFRKRPLFQAPLTIGRNTFSFKNCPSCRMRNGSCSHGNLLTRPQLRTAGLDHRFLNFFEHEPNPSLVNTSRPMPQTTFEKNNDCTSMDDFGSKLPSSCLMSAIYSFLQRLSYRQTQASSGNVENTQPRFGSPLRYALLTLLHPVWILTHTLGTTWLDQ